jgi:hopene-associated glycosyltransferase HpnB
MTTLAVAALVIWVYLVVAHGRFWQAGPVLPIAYPPADPPAVAVVVPARDEAPVIEVSIRSLLAQDYPGPLRVILVDDDSKDGTGALAATIHDPRLSIITGAPRPTGWSGKLWAVSQGVGEAGTAELILFTDADIVHDSAHVSSLVAKAERADLDLVSEMVKLNCESWAERALVPAFVFFFQLLYPFNWVNDSLKATAAAAGGTMLIRRRALGRIGGVESVRAALVDDVALAAMVKKGGRIWLGHSDLATSIRSYPSVPDIWRMVTRTAFVQLRYSIPLLVATTLGMGLIWLVPPAAAVFGHGLAVWCGVAAWLLLSLSYLPKLRRFGRASLWAPLLPLIAGFYMAATIGSAVNHYVGHGVAWKGRSYSGHGA